MWEHFTTKPYLSEVRFIDHVLTPWSSWMLAASPKATSEKADLVKEFMERLSESVRRFDDADSRKSTSKDFVMKQFDYPEDDVKAWLEGVKYPSTVRIVEQKTLDNTLSFVTSACSRSFRTDKLVLQDT